MGREIERKFLVAHDGWRAHAIDRRRMRDGLVSMSDTGVKVRVRVDQDRAWLAVKGPRIGIVRREYEYPIPYADGLELLAEVCRPDLVERTRFCVPHGGLIWSVDVFEGQLSGLTLAEVELAQADQAFPRPDWASLDVSDHPRFRQSALLAVRKALGRPLTVADLLQPPEV